MAAMEPIRCEAHILNKDTLETTFKDNYKAIDEWPHKWEKKTVTYSVIRGTEDLPDDSFERLAMNLAMTTWDVEIALDLKWVPKDENPDITLEFRPSAEDELFKKKPGVLAYAYYPGQGSVSGIIVFNDDYLWGMKHDSMRVTNPDGTISNVRIYNLIHTLIHEIGHSLGLKHTQDCKTCVMYPYYNREIELKDYDILRIRAIYGIRMWVWRRYARFKKALLLRKMRF